MRRRELLPLRIHDTRTGRSAIGPNIRARVRRS
jgi:hypothetical protein